MPRVDFEVIFDQIAASFRSQLGPKITEINTEKGDFSLDAFDSTKDYFEYNLPSKDTVPNRPAFFVQTIENPGVTSIETASAFSFPVGVYAYVHMKGDGNDDRRLLRYGRIVRDIIDETVAYEWNGVRIMENILAQYQDGQRHNLFLIVGTIFSVSNP